MKILTVDSRLVDHRRIRRKVYRVLRIIRAKGYGVNGVDNNVRIHRNAALHDLKHGLKRLQRRLDRLGGRCE